RARLKNAHDGSTGETSIEGRVKEGAIRFAARLAEVRDSEGVTLLLAGSTNFKNYRDVSADPIARNEAVLTAARRKGYAALRAEHIADHQRLFRRVSIDLGATSAANLPTDERIAKFAGGSDPSLVALVFQFGRYLLIESSRPGGQPANLQGLWNESMTPPWESKYTININTEMNYWPAESCNLAECVEPLTSMVMDLSETGVRTAKAHYGARGCAAGGLRGPPRRGRVGGGGAGGFAFFFGRISNSAAKGTFSHAFIPP